MVSCGYHHIHPTNHVIEKFITPLFSHPTRDTSTIPLLGTDFLHILYRGTDRVHRLTGYTGIGIDDDSCNRS